MSAPTVPMGQYLFRRIKELGTEHILGVPGDFNRQSLALPIQSSTLRVVTDPVNLKSPSLMRSTMFLV